MKKAEEFFKEKIQLLSQGVEILDVGGAEGFIKLLAPYKELFKNSHYRTLDVSPEVKPDILGDAHNVPLPNSCLDGVISISVLEHVKDPQQVINEIYRLLKVNGRALLYAPFLFPYHAREGQYHYPDYFRFTKDGLTYLARNFSKIELCPVMLFFEAWFFMLPQPLRKLLTPIGRWLDKIFKPKGNQTSGHYLYLEK